MSRRPVRTNLSHASGDSLVVLITVGQTGIMFTSGDGVVTAEPGSVWEMTVQPMVDDDARDPATLTPARRSSQPSQ